MPRSAYWKYLGVAGVALIISAGSVGAQGPCTNQQAFATKGNLSPDSREQADLDRRTRTKPDPAVRKKIDETIQLLKQALPDLTGVSGKYWHQIADTGANDYVFRFWITSAFFDYYCVPSTYPPDQAGKVRLGDETGTWIYIYFNSLGWLANEDVSLGKEIRTADGKPMFLLPRDDGEWKGHRVYFPQSHGESAGAVILTPPGRFPFKPVSREEFLLARERVHQKYYDEARANGGPDSPGAKERERQLEEIRKFRTSMAPALLQSQAVVIEWSGDPSRGRVFASDTNHGLRLVTVDHTYMDKSLPKSAVQLIVLYWRWEPGEPVKMEMMRQFKNNLDLSALERLLDR